jgi:hypothetical protein
MNTYKKTGEGAAQLGRLEKQIARCGYPQRAKWNQKSLSLYGLDVGEFHESTVISLDHSLKSANQFL